MMYENMKVKIEHIVDKGEISDEYITDDQQRQALNKWTKGFTRIDHPTVIQVCFQLFSKLKIKSNDQS